MQADHPPNLFVVQYASGPSMTYKIKEPTYLRFKLGALALAFACCLVHERQWQQPQAESRTDGESL